MPSKQFSESFISYFQGEHSGGMWTMEYMEELDEDLAETLSAAMAKVEWKQSPNPLWSFASLLPIANAYKPLQFNERGSTADFPLAIEFNGIQLCPRLVGWDQDDKMAGLFGWSYNSIEDELRESCDFDSGVDIGSCVELAQAKISEDKKAGFELYGIPKPMQSLSDGPEVVLYFYGLLSKALGYAFYEYGQAGLLEKHMDLYKDCQKMWDWLTKQTSEQA
jgi:hypothetical protein